MVDHAVRDEELAVLVVIQAPRIRSAVHHDFKGLGHRMNPPHAAVQRHALVIPRAGLADQRPRQDSVASIKPAVRSPGQGVECVVLGFQRPAVEQHLRRSVGFVVAVFIGDENQIRSRAQPHAAEAQLDSGEVTAFVPEHDFLIESAVAVLVFQNGDAVAPRLAVGLPFGIGQAFHNPQPPAVVDGKRDGLDDIRFRREHARPKSLRQLHAAGRFFGRLGSRRILPAAEFRQTHNETEQYQHRPAHEFPFDESSTNR